MKKREKVFPAKGAECCCCLPWCFFRPALQHILSAATPGRAKVVSHSFDTLISLFQTILR